MSAAEGVRFIWGGVTVLAHVDAFAPLRDLWLYLDDAGRWRLLAPPRHDRALTAPDCAQERRAPALSTVLDQALAEEIKPWGR